MPEADPDAAGVLPGLLSRMPSAGAIAAGGFTRPLVSDAVMVKNEGPLMFMMLRCCWALLSRMPETVEAGGR